MTITLTHIMGFFALIGSAFFVVLVGALVNRRIAVGLGNLLYAHAAGLRGYSMDAKQELQRLSGD